MKRNDIDKLEIYHESMNLADRIWHIVIGWSGFPKETIGYQVVKASDSIAANISEGYGHYFFKDNRQFCYIARGSLYETKTFIIKAKNRNLLNLQDYTKLMHQVELLLKKLNSYIKFIELQIKTH